HEVALRYRRVKEKTKRRGTRGSRGSGSGRRTCGLFLRDDDGWGRRRTASRGGGLRRCLLLCGSLGLHFGNLGGRVAPQLLRIPSSSIQREHLVGSSLGVFVVARSKSGLRCLHRPLGRGSPVCFLLSPGEAPRFPVRAGPVRSRRLGPSSRRSAFPSSSG